MGTPKQTFSLEIKGQEPTTVTLTGRCLWLASRLKQAGHKGLTEADAGGVTVKEYIYRITKERGVPIHREWEKHTGPHAGRHRRYWLDCTLTPISGGLPNG